MFRARFLAFLLVLPFSVAIASPAFAAKKAPGREEAGAERTVPGEAQVWVTRTGTQIIQVDNSSECFWRHPKPDEIRNQIALGGNTGIIDTDGATRILDDGTAQILVVLDCEAIALGDLTYRWVTIRTTTQIAEQARRTIVLETPLPVTQPDFGLVANPLWLHVTNDWQPLQATATVSGISATAIATPTKVTWRFGELNTIVCDDPGKEYTSRMNPTDPPCGFFPDQTSLNQTDDQGNQNRVTVTIEIEWGWSWTATDGSRNNNWGSETTTTQIHDFAIAELQTINT